MIEEDVDKVEREEYMSVVRKLLYDCISAGILQLCLIKKWLQYQVIVFFQGDCNRKPDKQALVRTCVHDKRPRFARSV